jgi:hypothetical protein
MSRVSMRMTESALAPKTRKWSATRWAMWLMLAAALGAWIAVKLTP